MFDFDKMKDKLIGMAVEQLPLDKLAESALQLVNGKPNATAEAYDAMSKEQQTSLMDGVLGFLQSAGITGKQAGAEVEAAEAHKASGLDFSNIVEFVQGNPDLLKGLLNSDLLKNEQIRSALVGLLGMVAKKLMG